MYIGVNELPVGFLGIIGCFVLRKKSGISILLGNLLHAQVSHCKYASMKLENMLQHAGPQLKF